jgi:hypothetical protein
MCPYFLKLPSFHFHFDLKTDNSASATQRNVGNVPSSNNFTGFFILFSCSLSRRIWASISSLILLASASSASLACRCSGVSSGGGAMAKVNGSSSVGLPIGIGRGREGEEGNKLNLQEILKKMDGVQTQSHNPEYEMTALFAAGVQGPWDG